MNPVSLYLAVMAGGAIGAAARLLLSGAIAQNFGATFPWGTLAVNVTGCLAIGLFTGLSGPDGLWLLPPIARQAVTIGVLGGFTTFSSFSFQTLELMAGGQWLEAGGNVLMSVFLCLLATWGGLSLAAALQSRP